MSFTDSYSTTVTIGIIGWVATIVGWIIICSNRGHYGMTPQQRAKQLEQNAIVCFVVGTIKIVIGLFLALFMFYGTTWGLLLLLFGILWLFRGFRWRQYANALKNRAQWGPGGPPVPGRFGFMYAPPGAPVQAQYQQQQPQQGYVVQGQYPAQQGQIGQVPPQQHVQQQQPYVVQPTVVSGNGYARVNDNEDGEGKVTERPPV